MKLNSDNKTQRNNSLIKRAKISIQRDRKIAANVAKILSQKKTANDKT